MKLMTATHSTRIPTKHRRLSGARREIGRWLDQQPSGNVPGETAVGDIEMVISELGANVIDHTASTWMRLGVELAVDRAIVTITNPAPAGALPPVEVWGTLEEGDRGRGLRVVRALCQSIVVTGDDELTHVRCEVPLA